MKINTKNLDKIIKAVREQIKRSEYHDWKKCETCAKRTSKKDREVFKKSFNGGGNQLYYLVYYHKKCLRN